LLLSWPYKYTLFPGYVKVFPSIISEMFISQGAADTVTVK